MLFRPTEFNGCRSNRLRQRQMDTSLRQRVQMTEFMLVNERLWRSASKLIPEAQGSALWRSHSAFSESDVGEGGGVLQELVDEFCGWPLVQWEMGQCRACPRARAWSPTMTKQH